MRPIPRALLIHSATTITEGTPNLWDARGENERTALTYVRLEPSSTLKISKQNEQIQLNAVLFYDCRNSRPLNFDFSHAQKINIDGESYRIVSIDKISDNSGLHHIEVGLCL